MFNGNNPEKSMKRNLPIFITILSIIIAAVSASSAVKANKQKKLAEAETERLLQKIAKTPPPPRRRPPAKSGKTALESAGNTNELVTLDSADDQMVEPQQERPQRESFADRMARMKEEDPEGYEEMIQQRQERQETIRYNLAERTATFMDLDSSNMTEDERANHELLVEKMAKVWTLTEQFQDPETPSDREAMQELFSELRDVRPLMDQERTVMFKQLGTDLGYEGEHAEEFATHVEDIIQATTLQVPGSRRGSSGGGGGGRGDRNSQR